MDLNNSTLHKLFLFFFSVQLLLPAQVALADTGPKPQMEFTFQQEMAGEKINITSGILYECEQADCSDASPLEELGPQGFYCNSQSCNAMAYGFSPYHKLEIQFADGQTRESNIFETAGFDSNYIVIVRQDDLVVESQFNPSGFLPWNGVVLLLCACVLMIGVVAVGLIIFLVLRRSRS